MKSLPQVILLLISSFLIHPAPAAGSAGEELLKKAQNPNVAVP